MKNDFILCISHGGHGAHFGLTSFTSGWERGRGRGSLDGGSKGRPSSSPDTNPNPNPNPNHNPNPNPNPNLNPNPASATLRGRVSAMGLGEWYPLVSHEFIHFLPK